MSLASTHRSIMASVRAYETLLDRVSEDDFVLTPPRGGWSYAEVYAHIFSINKVCFAAIRKCIEGKAVESDAPLHWKVRLVFLFGRFPSGFKVPDRFKDDVQKISRDDARKMISDFMRELEAVTPELSKAPKTQKQKHPRMGMLNAVRWYEFISIHTRHHERQLNRIRKSLQG